MAELEHAAAHEEWDSHLLDPDHETGRSDIDDLLTHFHSTVIARWDVALGLGDPIHIDRPVLLIIGALPRTSPVLHRLRVLACHGPAAGVHLAIDLELAQHLPTVIARQIGGLFEPATTPSLPVR